jgi:tRNA dimethylallyltransferase
MRLSASIDAAAVPRFFCIAGPTACGKSALAAEVALRCDGEIVGADAFQVYDGLDILTAKPARELRERVPHHLIGCVPLALRFDVAQYRALALAAIRAIAARGRLPVVVGGTGLYFRSLTHGLADLPQADAALRAELSALPLAELQQRYKRLDPAGAERIDMQNPRRLVRAIEVCELTGRPFSSFREWPATEGSPGGSPSHARGAAREGEAPAEPRGVLLGRSREELYRRIDARVVAMFGAGVVEEVRACGEVGATAAQAIGFREIKALLRGEISKADCIAAIQQATRRYAKRQLTWFRREPSFGHLDLSSSPDFQTSIDTVAQAALRFASSQDV